MSGIVRALVGLLLLAHGLVHLIYLAPDVPQFSVERSWLVPEAGRRPVALVLMTGTAASFALVALAVWGVPRLSEAWPALTGVACVLSLVLLVAYWNPSLVFGIALDVALLVVALLQPAWASRIVGGGG
ncbi:MAG: hypothetical protein ACXVWU_07900 [Nocardioides sp.]